MKNSDLEQLRLAVRSVLAQHGKLSVDANQISDETDLYYAGLTSLSTVTIMLALEDQFDVEFSDSMLSRATFQSVESLSIAIESLLD